MKAAPPNWPNDVPGAISIAYCGGREDHLDIARPVLGELKIPATFYVEPTNVLKRLEEWKELAAFDHEIGNACLDGFTDQGELLNWTHAAVQQEIVDGEQFIEEIFGRKSVGFFAPGQELLTAQGSYEPILAEIFSHVLSPKDGMNTLKSDLLKLDALKIAKYPDQLLSSMVGAKPGSWLILRFDVLLKTNDPMRVLVHRLVLEAVHRLRTKCWVAPVGEVAAKLRSVQEEGSTALKAVAPPATLN